MRKHLLANKNAWLLTTSSLLFCLFLYVIWTKITGRFYGIDLIVWGPIILFNIIFGVIIGYKTIIFSLVKKVSYVPIMPLLLGIILAFSVPSRLDVA